MRVANRILLSLIACLFYLSLFTLSLFFSSAAQADTFDFTLTNGGVAARLVNDQSRKTSLAPTPLLGLKKEPEGLVDPQYAAIEIGPKDHKATFLVILEEQEGKEPRLFVDANGDGDLTNDPPVTLTKVPYTSYDGKKLTRMEWAAVLQVPYENKTVPMRIILRRSDPQDPNYSVLQDQLLYICDYMREGTLKLAGVDYKAVLIDLITCGDFRGNFSKAFPGTVLLIDVNHNGKFEERGESYSIDKPFNIRGTTYKLNVLDAAGSRVEVVKSTFSVPEILPPPDLKVGKQALPFTYKTLDGKTVHFPNDYKGKLVLLYFWGDWCPKCAHELPNLKRAYAKYHPRGVEILGVCIELTTKVGPKQVSAFTKANQMPWMQIFDGVKGELATLYFVKETPTPLLVDGDTGKILATHDDLVGPPLAKTLERNITKKKH